MGSKVGCSNFPLLFLFSLDNPSVISGLYDGFYAVLKVSNPRKFGLMPTLEIRKAGTNRHTTD